MVTKVLRFTIAFLRLFFRALLNNPLGNILNISYVHKKSKTNMEKD